MGCYGVRQVSQDVECLQRYLSVKNCYDIGNFEMQNFPDSYFLGTTKMYRATMSSVRFQAAIPVTVSWKRTGVNNSRWQLCNSRVL